jgi:hypothetical protein
MNVLATTQTQTSAKLFYTNPYTNERLSDQNAEYSISDVARFLSEFTRPNVSLITTMPSGLGVDFHSESDGSIWIEFYGDVLQSTFTDLATAQKILERAFNSELSKPVREIFSDLIDKWEY